MLCTAGSIEVEDDILQRSGLRGGPVNASGGEVCRNLGRVQDKVTNLPEESVGSTVAGLSNTWTRALVWRAVDETNTSTCAEVGRSLDRGQTVGVANDLVLSAQTFRLIEGRQTCV